MNPWNFISFYWTTALLYTVERCLQDARRIEANRGAHVCVKHGYIYGERNLLRTRQVLYPIPQQAWVYPIICLRITNSRMCFANSMFDPWHWKVYIERGKRAKTKTPKRFIATDCVLLSLEISTVLLPERETHFIAYFLGGCMPYYTHSKKRRASPYRSLLRPRLSDLSSSTSFRLLKAK